MRRYLLMVEESRTPFRTPTERQLRFSCSHHISPLPYLSLKDVWDAALEVGQICAGKHWSWQTELAQ